MPAKRKATRTRATGSRAKNPVSPRRGDNSQLEEYRPKRDFSRLAYVIQKHAARSLHYDLRLELDGVMKSWAVPRGPSLDPAVSWVLVRIRRGDPNQPEWLLIKHRDEFAEPETDVAAEYQTSVACGRTMDAIGRGRRASLGE